MSTIILNNRAYARTQGNCAECAGLWDTRLCSDLPITRYGRCLPYTEVPLPVGTEFHGITRGGRSIKNGVIRQHGEGSFLTRWDDENGKHYEWFTREEFDEFNIIN